ncbi:hypothetical protein L1987_56128 [Smallanthus sonchifolius]|uniref:Uncharacterized protein n=1 Tax=Smallanthus sonchifolius TaxID=185202 RepID=A0ACB9EBA8_9ASTR|nr:hypothetical protein L1987_56128 [Smallanthus sonchifolius]
MWLSFPSELFLDYKQREKLARRSKRDTLSEKAHEQNTKRVLKVGYFLVLNNIYSSYHFFDQSLAALSDYLQRLTISETLE